MIILPLKYLFVGQSLMLELTMNDNPFFARVFLLSQLRNCSIIILYPFLNRKIVEGLGQSGKIKMNRTKKRATDLITIKAFTILIDKNTNYENNSPAHRLIY